ncbi:2-(3-amino-3-carboxypropyl)histidine synthase subunit 2-like protein [Tanacetum coccineum]|uniref:2-(3-amino-3-carboxypropyl)histidine synthase subunit 2-like protein n=1 Tax=Tanacetum coccineum TaxID=301880 RepID=A0ABQ5HPM1_9ASTR
MEILPVSSSSSTTVVIDTLLTNEPIIDRVHCPLVFVISFLKPYHEDGEDPERGVSKRAPTTVVTSYNREVDEILSDRTIRRRGVTSYKEFLIKWCDLQDSEASWEAKDLLWQFSDEIKRYREDDTTRTSRA